MFIFSSRVCAENLVHFDFLPVSPVTSSSGVLNIIFSYNLVGFEPKDFVVRPKILAGQINIWKESLGWAAGGLSWSALPDLSENMLVKINAGSLENVGISFEIQNKLTGKIYETPKRNVKTYRVFDKYAKNLQLKVFDAPKPETDTIYSNAETPVISKGSLSICLPTFFCAFLAGFLIRRFSIKIAQ